MLVDRESVTPEFWRAPTDNDYGAWLQQRFGVWKNPQMKLKDCQVGDNSVVATFEMPEVQATLSMTYTLQENGEVVVNEHFLPNPPAEGKDVVRIPPMFRFGMQWVMPAEYDNIKFMGRGPHENYIDRNHSQKLGLYSQKVADQYWGYVRPQESGNKTDVRYWQMLDASGKGLQFLATGPMEASALPYLPADLDDGPRKDAHQSHSGDLTPRKFNVIQLQARQFGLACVTSWGAWPRNEHQMQWQDRDFTYIVKAVK